MFPVLKSSQLRGGNYVPTSPMFKVTGTVRNSRTQETYTWFQLAMEGRVVLCRKCSIGAFYARLPWHIRSLEWVSGKLRTQLFHSHGSLMHLLCEIVTRKDWQMTNFQDWLSNKQEKCAVLKLPTQHLEWARNSPQLYLGHSLSSPDGVTWLNPGEIGNELL